MRGFAEIPLGGALNCAKLRGQRKHSENNSIEALLNAFQTLLILCRASPDPIQIRLGGEPPPALIRDPTLFGGVPTLISTQHQNETII